MGGEGGMLQEFGSNIWLAEGPCVSVLGFHYPTRLAAIRLAHGAVVVWSPITLSPNLRRAVEGLGPVAQVLAPNSLHHLALPAWRTAYPAARFHAPPGLRTKRQDIAFDGDLGDEADPAWAGEIDQVIVRGNRITDEVVFFHRESGTVLFTDLLQQFPDDWFGGWRRVIAKLDLMVAPEPSVPRKFRLAFRDRAAAKASLARIKAWPARSVVMAHGTPVTVDAPSYLDRAFRWLTG